MTISSADDAAIRALIGKAAYYADNAKAEDYRELYTSDGVFDLGTSVQRGVDEVVAGADRRRSEGVSGPGTHTRHVVVPLHVVGKEDGEAVAYSYLTFYVSADTAPKVAVVAMYEDTVRSEDGDWRIAYRRVIPG
jgi:3-phenylpropionate/cinnamic acid dioxygenase small subunit